MTRRKSYSRFIFFMLCVLTVCCIFSCMKKQKKKALPEIVSFKNDLIPLFNASCVTSGCHIGSNPAADLDLSESAAYLQLFKRNMVDTLNPDGSSLYKEVASGAMPKGNKKLSEYNIGIIQRWIEQKAKNN